MKRIVRYMIMVACAIAMVGCQKELDGILTATIEDGEGGDEKVYIDNNRYACWHEGDKVSVNGIDGTILLQGDNNDALVLGIDISDLTRLDAVYPAMPELNKVEWKGVQRYRESVMPDGTMAQVVEAPMVATAVKDAEGNANLVFKNVGGLVKVSVPQVAGENGAQAAEKKVRRIEVKNLNNGNLWGEASYGWNVNGEPTMGALSGGSNSVAMDIPTTATVHDFYVAVPQLSGAKLEVKVIYEEIVGEAKTFKVMTKTTKVITMDRNKMLSINGLEGVDYVLRGEGTEASPYLIESELDFDALRAQAQTNLYKGKHFRQEVDLVVPNPATYEGIDFEGVYDGNGKTITLGAVDKPSPSGIFGMVGSSENAPTVIKNLNAQVVIDCSSYKVGGVAMTIRGSADILNCKVMGSVKSDNQSNGGIVGEVASYNNGTINIENCTNMADVNMGGIVGLLEAGVLSIKNCVNEGTIHGVNITSNYNNGCGGIIGQCSTGSEDDRYFSLIVENCINKGNVDGNAQRNSYIGGILGHIDNIVDFDLKIINCCNLGHINNRNASNEGIVGGIVGRLDYNSGNCHIIDRCINKGVIEGRVYVGGLCGSNSNANNHPLYISNSMNLGSVFGYDNNVGGLIGYGSSVEIRNSCNMGDVKCDNKDGNISGLIGKGENMVLNNVYVGGTISILRINWYYRLEDNYYVVGSGTIPSTFTITNVYIPESGHNVNSTSVKRYDAHWNVVGMIPATSLVDALNGNRVTLPEGISKEPWVMQNGKPALQMVLTSLPLPGTGNQNEGYGEIGGVEWN